MNRHELPMLPPRVELETVKVLKQLSKTSRALAELKGYAETIPNKNILLNAATIIEAKDSSEIENIITTHDDLYRALNKSIYASSSAKEVANYRSAMWKGCEIVRVSKIITINMIKIIQGIIEKNDAGIRKLPGTVLQNDKTSEIVYTPPEGFDTIMDYMSNLEKYINDDVDEVDPLIKLAVIHYQFESIHPFYDGNGRTGRIINILYLLLKGLLDQPILYLSSYIIKNKADYYRLLQEVRTKNAWEEWVLYILTAIEETSMETLGLIKKINIEIEKMQIEIRSSLPKIYTQELIDLLFYEFYTKTSVFEKELSISRKTAVSYLTQLESNGFIHSEKIGKERIYLNYRLLNLIKSKSSTSI